MKYRRPSDRKEDRLAFGVWSVVSLADARTKHDETKRLLAKGIDPKAEQKGGRSKQRGHFPLKPSHANNKTWSVYHSARAKK